MKVRPGKISDKEYGVLKALQNVFKILLRYNLEKLSYGEFLQLARELEEYREFSFMTEFNKIIDRVKSKHRVQQARKVSFSKNYESFKNSYSRLVKSINSKNYSLVKRIALSILPLTSKIIESYRSSEDILDKEFRNPFYYENLLIFGDPNALLREFTYDDMRRFVNLDLDVYRYSYLPFPKGKDLDWLLYYVKQLKPSGEEVELTDSEFIRYQKFLYAGNPKFKRLVSLVEAAMRRNEKASIKKILALVREFPEINERNEVSKNEIKVVYRGVPGDNLRVKDVLREDKLKEYVSASVSKRAARRFALRIGHLESEASRRSEVGYIITYGVGYDSILLDTRIFGSIFTESEVLIDPSMANVVRVEVV